MRLTTLLARIAVRTGVAMWRQRLTWLGGGLAVGLMSLYQLTYAGPTVAAGDCADTTMAAVTRVDDEVARAAYACLGPSMRRSSEDEFVQAMRTRNQVRPERVNRVGDQRTRDGGRIVFFTVEAQGQAVGYIVYLDRDGKVQKIE